MDSFKVCEIKWCNNLIEHTLPENRFKFCRNCYGIQFKRDGTPRRNSSIFTMTTPEGETIQSHDSPWTDRVPGLVIQKLNPKLERLIQEEMKKTEKYDRDEFLRLYKIYYPQIFNHPIGMPITKTLAEQAKEYHSRPEIKARRKEYRSRDVVKERERLTRRE